MDTVPVSVEESLFGKLDRESLEPQEVVDGVRECFILSHRTFMQRRQPNLSTEKIDDITCQLVDDVFGEEDIRPQTATYGTLKRVVTILDEQFNFAADPDIASQHQQVIGKLLIRMPMVTLL